jgi:nuclear GTP-binding protein
VAPIAGETKVWQYITLMKKVYLIDCPGVVPPGQETDEEKVMSSLIYVVVPSVLGICDILVRIRTSD